MLCTGVMLSIHVKLSFVPLVIVFCSPAVHGSPFCWHLGDLQTFDVLLPVVVVTCGSCTWSSIECCGILCF